MLAVSMPCAPRALRLSTRRPPQAAAARRCGGGSSSRGRPRTQQLRVCAAAPSADEKQRPRFPRNLLKPEPTEEETASIVKSMRQLGLRSSRDLRLFLLRRSVGRSARLALDIGVNFLAAMACSATFRGLLLLDERTMPDALRAVLCGLAAFGTGWFLTTVAGDMVVISVTTFASLRYGLAADAFVDAALRDDPAGERGRSPMGGAKAAASALAAVSALEDVMRVLQERAGGRGGSAADTARALSGFFVLQAAEEERGWKPESAGLSEQEALAAARAFSAADTDGDGTITATELRALMTTAAGKDVPLEEAQAALQAVADGAEALSFEQFARWWHSAKASHAPADAAQRVAEPPPSSAA